MPDFDQSVLVVEDDREVNELVGAYAQIAGFSYRPALDGAAALDAARTGLPSLIILDIMLPDMDGLEVCRRLKSESQTKDIPVVILTALDRDEYRQQGRAAGAAAYLTKPFDPDRLMEAMKAAAGKNRGCQR